MTIAIRTFYVAAVFTAGLLSLSLASCGGSKAEAHGEGAEAGEHAAEGHGDEHAVKDDGHAKADSHGAKDDGHGAAKDSGHGKGGHDKAASGHGKSDGHGAAKDAHGKSDGHGAAKGGHGKSDGHGKADAHGAPAKKRVYQPGDMVEVDLGEFTVTQRQEEQHSILLIHFQIFGLVDHEKQEQFEKLLEDRRQRLRDLVITTVQGADAEQLSDPGLAWLKSELVPAVNKLLKSRLLKDVVFSDFAMLQN